MLAADAGVEEAVREAEAKRKQEREREVKEADRDAAEMAALLASDPEVRGSREKKTPNAEGLPVRSNYPQRGRGPPGRGDMFFRSQYRNMIKWKK